MGKRRKVAIFDLVEPDLIDLKRSVEKTGILSLQLHFAGLAGRRGDEGGSGLIRHGLADDLKRHAATLSRQPLFLQFRLLHEPMSDAAVERHIRAAALEAARPEPALVGQEHADTTLERKSV